MRKIHLSKNEKRVLRCISLDVAYWPEDMSEETVSGAASSLQELGLVHALFASGHRVVDASLTDFGMAYLSSNPGLRNPINWSVIGAVAGVVAAIAAVAALFIACSLL